MAEGSSASAAGSDVLDPELAGVDSECESSFDEDQETTEERETTKTTSEASNSMVVSLLDRLRAPKKSELT